MMDLTAFFNSQMNEREETLARTRAQLGGPFARLCEGCLKAIRGGGKIIFFGNGGSAADSQHLAAELTVRFRKNRAPIPAIALTTDTSALTAIGNDFGFEELFARQVKALARQGDVVIGFSTSGTSPNVIKGLAAAREMGAIPVGFGAGDGARMAEVCDSLLLIPATDTARIQEMHITLGHMLCAVIEEGIAPS